MAGNKDYTKAESIYDFTAKGMILEPFKALNFYNKIKMIKRTLSNLICLRI